MMCKACTKERYILLTFSIHFTFSIYLYYENKKFGLLK